MSARAAIVDQFRRPHGPLGYLAGWVMALRSSNRKRSRWTVELLQLQQDDRVLEIGCGPGLALAACLAAHESVSAVGVDHSELMIQQARRRNKSAYYSGRLHLVFGGLERLPFAGKGFSKCLLVNVLQFSSDRVEALRLIARALEPGATIAITFQPRNPKARTEHGRTFVERVEEDLVTAGFERAAIHKLDLRPIPAFCVVARRCPNDT